MNTTANKPTRPPSSAGHSPRATGGTSGDAARAARRREREILLGRIGRLWIAFVRGQLVLMLLVGAATWLGLTLLGVRGALWLGVAAGVLEAVPNLGPLISTALGAIVALRYGSAHFAIHPALLAALTVVFYALVQLLENYLIVPRVMGDALRLPALVVLAGVIIGGAVASVPGAILATPLIATARELWRYAQHKRRGEEPFPQEQARGK